MNTHSLTHLPADKLYSLFMNDYKKINSVCDSLTYQSWQRAQAKNKKIHRMETIPLHGKTFLCEVNATSEKAGYTVYRIMNNGNHFYSIAYNPETYKFFHYSEHFFIRYRERLQLAVSEHEKLLLRFLQKNDHLDKVTFYPQENSKLKSFCNVLPEGIAYGIYDTENNIYYYRTFVSHSLVRFDQKVNHSLPFNSQEAASVLREKFKVTASKNKKAYA